MLEKIQRRATKLIPGLRDLSCRGKIKGMWSNNRHTEHTKIEGGSKRNVLRLLNGLENIYPDIIPKIKTGKRSRGHHSTLVK